MKSSNILVFILKSYSGILFLPNWQTGLIILLTTLLQPNLGISGLICILSSFIFARFLGIKDNFFELDYYIYNPLLVGLSVGYLFKLSLLTIFLIICLGILTFLLTYSLSSIFWNYLRLPVLSIPFVIISIIFYLASWRYSKLFVLNLYQKSQDIFSIFPIHVLNGFLSSLGIIFFQNIPLIGLIIFCAIFWKSRILAFLSLLGYFIGSFVSYLLVGSQIFFDLNNFNYILIAIAIGGVFLIPSPKSYIISCIAVLVSVPIVEAFKVFWENFGIPAFALPFNMVTLLFIYCLGLIGFKYVCYLYRGSPEKTLDYYLTTLRRFPLGEIKIGLPFSGQWYVWQSFKDDWTHQGPWQYAVDFIVTDEKGKSFKNDGNKLEDYFAFKKPILSPITGRVVSVVNNIEDNPPGSVNSINNWGNFVLIYDLRGFYVLLAHFLKGSIKVKEGDWITRGQILGLCGNSGYSPQPHIHIHVQKSPNIGAPTVPFCFTAYISNGYFVDSRIPQKGDIIEPVFPDKALKHKVNFLLDMKFHFEIEKPEKKEKMDCEIKMHPNGLFYLTDGRARLFFGLQEEIFYFYSFEGDKQSPLKYFFIAVPKLPLFLKENLRWEDFLPLELGIKPWEHWIKSFIISFNHDLYQIKGFYKALSDRKFCGKIKIHNKELFYTEVIFDENPGFYFITIYNKTETIKIRRLK